MSGMSGSDLDRFWSKVDIDPDGCWIWRAALTDGYGRFRWGGRSARAHRVAYELVVGAIPNGLQLDHLCRDRACVNPAHLEPVTNRENTVRGLAPALSALRQRSKSNCPQGHPYDQANTYWTPAGTRQCRTCKADHKRRGAA